MEPVKLRNKNGAEYLCHTEGHLKSFKEAGWVEADAPATPSDTQGDAQMKSRKSK